MTKTNLNKIQLNLDREFPSEYDAKEAAEIISQIADLLSVQWPEIKKVIDANNGEISLAFKADLDHTRPESRVVQVGVSFSQKFKDACELATAKTRLNWKCSNHLSAGRPGIVCQSLMKLSFSLACTPPRVTKQMKKTIFRKGRVLHIDTLELKEAQALYMEKLVPFRPETPLTGPLRLSVFWHFAHNESAPLRRSEHLCWKDTSPDLDNCEKLLIDTMQKMGFFANDGQVALKQTAKVYDPEMHGLVIEIEQLPEFAQ